MKIIDKFYSFIHIHMARKCKDCPKQEEIVEEVIEKQEEEEHFDSWIRAYFFPNEWRTIYARSYKEALQFLNSTKQ